jgi:hypothetical protein
MDAVGSVTVSRPVAVGPVDVMSPQRSADSPLPTKLRHFIIIYVPASTVTPFHSNAIIGTGRTARTPRDPVALPAVPASP